MNEKISAAIEELKEKSKKRNFPQTFDLIISLKSLILKNRKINLQKMLFYRMGEGKMLRLLFFLIQ